MFILVSLKRFVCQCHLVYSKPSVCIDLARYEPLENQYKNEKIVLTPTLSLDYGLLGQVLFSDPAQIDPFGRKIATVVLNTFVNTNNSFVELIIDSKPPEWNELGIILAQHKIVVIFHKFRPSLYGTKFPWLCKQFSIKE